MQKSNREQLKDLLAATKADEIVALVELHDYLSSEEAQNFKARIEALHERTLPGAAYDQVLGSFLRSLEIVTNQAASVVSMQVRSENIVGAHPDPAGMIQPEPAIEQDPPVEPTAPISEDGGDA